MREWSKLQLEIGDIITCFNKKQNIRIQVIVTEIYDRYLVVKGQDQRDWKEAFLKIDLLYNIHPEYQFEYGTKKSKIA
ncbi:hypothetical protein [Ammoniphilus resinae]|uniref:Uncharacterized protein n=1 Tax=Ammoniphilus resinae TaxID=861532 RepID=A0ABS4GNH7_9BACL|nr:hypothetical protein [Ammoniphilus resinae]MBP1931826.1 hypothetical protein [Ammoniphilus resinae]